jgi:ABC-2 type transport system permease protein
MIDFVRQCGYLTLRGLRRLWRQPWYVALTLVQPVIWLLIFGQLFKRVVEIPGFNAGSYIDFLAPGIVIMSALFSSGWSGMGMIEAIERGVMDRFLVSPVRRAALIVGPLSQTVISIVVQSAIILALSFALGAHLAGGIAGAIVLVLCAALLGTTFGAISNGFALLARREETVIAAVNFIALPASFLSPILMQRDLVPGWIQSIIRFNPVAWAVDAGREALSATADWRMVLLRIALLLAVAVLGVAFATRTVRVYQRSL